MTGFLALLGIGYFLGICIAAIVVRVRAGLPAFDPIMPWDVGWSWFLMSVFMGLCWPVALALWLKAGRPEPSVVFGDKARERAWNQEAALAQLRGTVSEDGHWMWDGERWVPHNATG